MLPMTGVLTNKRNKRLQSIRRDKPAEILVSATCQTLAAHYDMCNQTISGCLNIGMQHAREMLQYMVPHPYLSLSWPDNPDLGDSVTGDVGNDKLGTCQNCIIYTTN